MHYRHTPYDSAFVAPRVCNNVSILSCILYSNMYLEFFRVYISIHHHNLEQYMSISFYRGYIFPFPHHMLFPGMYSNECCECIHPSIRPFHTIVAHDLFDLCGM